MITLYYSPGACSLAPHVVLEELGVRFEARRVVIADGETATPEFLAVNPKGRVPVLIVDDRPLTEAIALLAYLGSLRPEAGLLPSPGSLELGRCFEFMAFLASTLHIGYAQLWRPARFLPEGFPAQEAFTAQGREIVRRANAQIEAQLPSGWVLGSRYSVADAYLLPFWRWGLRIGLDMAADYPRWTAWKERMLARPAVRRAIAREGIEDQWGSDLPPAPDRRASPELASMPTLATDERLGPVL